VQLNGSSGGSNLDSGELHRDMIGLMNVSMGSSACSIYDNLENDPNFEIDLLLKNISHINCKVIQNSESKARNVV